MIDVRDATLDEIILAWLQAEVDGPYTKDLYTPALAQLRTDRASLIDNSDLDNAQQCADRSLVLRASRGLMLWPYRRHCDPTAPRRQISAHHRGAVHRRRWGDLD
jgi:hypothetical protein